MSLPILNIPHETTPDDLLRLFLRTELHWSSQIAQETELDVGTALVNAELAGLGQANRILNGVLPTEMSPQQAVEQVRAHFADAGAKCMSWTMNPSVGIDRAGEMTQYLLSQGYKRVTSRLYHLSGSPRKTIREAGRLQIIPSRASFRHTQALAQQEGGERQLPHWDDAVLLHLDDSHTDALIALKDGQGVATVSVLSVGEMGTIHNLYVTPAMRRMGLARTMLSRAMEICARSLFRHVFAQIEAENPAGTLLESVGFSHVGEVVSYEL